MVNNMTGLTLDAFQADARATSFFLNDPRPLSPHGVIYYGFSEEVNELLLDDTYETALSSMLLGRQNVPEHARAELISDKTAEAGDILYYIAAAHMLRGALLEDSARAGMALFTGSAMVPTPITLTDFDRSVSGHMRSPLARTFEPDYMQMQMYNLSLFEGDGYNHFHPADSNGPLTLTHDGRYGLDRIIRAYADEIDSNDFQAPSKDFLAVSGLLLGALSVVLQHRFGTSLEEAAINNMLKRDRRKEAGTLQTGADTGRSRALGDARPRFHGFDTTITNLVFAAPPLRG